MTNVKAKSGKELKIGDYVCVPSQYGIMEAKQILNKQESEELGCYITVENCGDMLIKLGNYYLVAQILEGTEDDE